jgi:hypothetical protein
MELVSGVTVQKAKNVYTTGIVARLFNFFSGRHTAFAIFFAITGTVLAFIGKLTDSYVALITAIQALILAHSAKEDWHEQKMGDRDRCDDIKH